MAIDKRQIIDCLTKVMNLKFLENDFIPYSFLITVSHYELNATDFDIDFRNLFNEKLNEILSFISKLDVLDKDLYNALAKLKILLSEEVNIKFKAFDPRASYFHIENKIPLSEDIFKSWMKNNVNPRVLVAKIFDDLCSKTGQIENKNNYTFKKRLDDLSRFLEYDSAVCTAIFLKSGTIYIANNKKTNRFYKFEELCRNIFYFFKKLIERRISEQHEKTDSLFYIYSSYKNNNKITEKTDDDKQLNIFYDQLQIDINKTVDENNLLLVKCKLFMRFKNCLKFMSMNDLSNPLIGCLKNEYIDIQHVPNDNKNHCEVAICDFLLLNNLTFDFNYIAISKLCCPLCYFVVSSLGIETRGCHKLLHYWSLPQVYKDNIKYLHGELFTRNFELSNYIGDIYKAIEHLPLLFSFKPANCQLISFKDNIPVSQYPDINS